MLSIGEFSRICFVTKKTLRHYDEMGLLRPEYTAENGYRYYTAGQLRTMLLINRLKGYGFSLPEISAVLTSPGGALLADKLAEKRRAMTRQVEETSRLLRQLDTDMDKLKRSVDIMEQNIVIKQVELEPQTIYSVRKHIDVSKEFQELFGQLYQEMAQKGIKPVDDAPMAFYHDEEFSAQHSDIELALRVAPGTPGSRELAGGPCAMATLLGPYLSEAFTATYTALMEWVEAGGYRINGAPFDKYVRGGPNVDPADYVTEIYFPIIK